MGTCTTCSWIVILSFLNSTWQVFHNKLSLACTQCACYVLMGFVTCTVHEYTTCLGTKLIPLVDFVVWITLELTITDCYYIYEAWSVDVCCLFSFCVFLGTMIQLVFLLFYCLLVNVVILGNFFPKLSSTNNNRVTQLYHISRFLNLDAVFMEICILPCIWFDFNPPVTGTTKSWAGPRNEADTWKYMYEKRPVWLCGLMM